MPKKSRGQKRWPEDKKNANNVTQEIITTVFAFAGRYRFDSAPDAPPGFGPLSMTQAMLEYARADQAYVEDGTVQDPNDALQVGLRCG